MRKAATNVAAPFGRFRSRPMPYMYHMQRKRQHTDKLNLRIDPELLAAIERIAQTNDRSIAWVVRDALTRYVHQEHGLTRP